MDIRKTYGDMAEGLVIGVYDAVISGKVVRNLSQKSVLVRNAADLALLGGYSPGTFAYTAGFTNMWQLGQDGQWYAIVEEA